MAAGSAVAVYAADSGACICISTGLLCAARPVRGTAGMCHARYVARLVPAQVERGTAVHTYGDIKPAWSGTQKD